MKFTDFVPDSLLQFFQQNELGFYQTSYMVGQTGVIWINTGEPHKAYITIPQLKAVIDRKAEMFSNMKLMLINEKSGKEVEDIELMKLLQNPNCNSSQNEFLRDYKQQWCVYGNQFMYRNKPSSLGYPVALWNISPFYMKPILSGKIFDQLKREDIISGYELAIQGKFQKYNPQDILFTKINDLDNPIIGMSPIVALKYPITNIKLAYQFRNVVMSNPAGLGIISNDSKDAVGNIAMKNEDRLKISKAVTKNYGIGAEQAKIIVTNAAIKFQHTAYPTKDMMLFEEVDADQMAIIDMYGMNINLFSNKNATFENVKNSIIQVYQDTIIPEADEFTQALGPFLGIPKGTRLVASYDHLTIMKENNEKGMSAIESIVRSLTQAVGAGILKAAQATSILQNELELHLDQV